jgi:hypothetical protein
MFFSRKKKPGNEKMILAMIMLSDQTGFDLKSFIADFTKNYAHPVDNLSGDNTGACSCSRHHCNSSICL